HDTAAKKVALSGIAMADAIQKMISDKDISDISSFGEKLTGEIDRIKSMSKKERAELERKMVSSLKAREVLTEIPNILGGDMNYYTANVTMREYRSDPAEYQGIVENIRAEILEPGEVSLETVCLLYLCRETGCMHDIFSVEEQEQIQRRMIELMGREPLYKVLFETEFHSGIRNAYLGFLRAKTNLFKNPYLEGVNLLFPFLDRKQAIFIDMIIAGTTVEERRKKTIEFLRKNGHVCEEVPMGSESFVKVDNKYYRIWPSTRSNKIPIQGIELLPVYM
ncbi:MAG: hypothetical protein K2G19_04555, partial [Lachnospiraceae bacterium]|nr:hypothetical protein [Lachnospiraceae bacterium]